MQYDQVIKKFSGVSATARALGIKRGIVFQWSKQKRIPTLHQLRLKKLSGGKLALDKRARKELEEILSLAR